jgi:hypothetical protein
MILHRFLHSQLFYASFLQSIIQGYMNLSVTALLALHFVSFFLLMKLGLNIDYWGKDWVMDPCRFDNCLSYLLLNLVG